MSRIEQMRAQKKEGTEQKGFWTKIKFTIIFLRLADAFIKSNLQHMLFPYLDLKYLSKIKHFNNTP